MVDSRCGLYCTNCEWKESPGCGGCIGTNGHPFHGKCPIASYSFEKGLHHCGECNVIPCEKLYEYSYLDPEHGDKPQGARVQVCRKQAAENGKQSWQNVLLTSAGFEDSEQKQKTALIEQFSKMLGKPFTKTKLLFIPEAAIDDESKEMAQWCFDELLRMGFKKENITVHKLENVIPSEEILLYDAVYLTGGDTGHLLRRLHETTFD